VNDRDVAQKASTKKDIVHPVTGGIGIAHLSATWTGHWKCEATVGVPGLWGS